MVDLIKLCFAFDRFHHELFDEYKYSLNLTEVTFLKEGRALSIEKRYDSISTSIDKILNILKEIERTGQEKVHQHLRGFYQLLLDAQGLEEPEKKKHKTKYKDVLANLAEAKKFFKKYEYKLTKNYLANNAILLSTLLYHSTKESTTKNIEPDETVLKITSTQKELTLSQIAEKICKATEIEPRNIQFIAIGVTGSGESWVTTNYHTPVIYPLGCFLARENYVKAEKLRSEYKVAHRQSDGGALVFSSGDKMIHAETMIASLKQLLRIERIFLIDGTGKKVENCQFCSHYLNQSGFYSEPHMESIQNYAVPTESQQNASVNFGLHLLDEGEQTEYEWINLNEEILTPSDEAIHLSRALLVQAFRLIPYSQPLSDDEILEQLFIAIKKHYPFSLDESTGLKNTYHLSRKLASPEKNDLSRTIVRTSVTARRHENLKIKLFDDDRLKIDASGNHLEAKEPTSPRSSTLSKYANEWLKKGDPSVRFEEQERQQQVIVLKR